MAVSNLVGLCVGVLVRGLLFGVDELGVSGLEPGAVPAQAAQRRPSQSRPPYIACTEARKMQLQLECQEEVTFMEEGASKNGDLF